MNPKTDLAPEAPADGGEAGRKAAWLEVVARAAGETTTEVVASTPRRDRMGDVVECDWKLEAYRRNPVILVDHDYRAESVVGRATRTEVRAGKLHAEIEWADTARARRVRELVDGGFLKSVSVGFLPGKVTPLTDKAGKYLGSRFTENELLEISFVPVPANADALVVCGLAERRQQIQTDHVPAGEEPAGDRPMSETKIETLSERIASLEEWNKGIEDKLSRASRPRDGEPDPVKLADGTPILERSHRLRDHVEGLDTRDLPPHAIGELVRGLVTGRVPAELKAQAEGVGTLGGYALTPLLSSEFIDLARNAAVVFKAGARTVPMQSAELIVPRLTADPTLAWIGENAAATETSATFGRYTLRARTLRGYLKCSRELIEDSPLASQAIENALVQAAALELDRAALLGDGSGEEPLGIRYSGANAITSVGTPADYAKWISGVASVWAANGEPNAVIVAPRDAGNLAALQLTTHETLPIPPVLSALAWFRSNQIPIESANTISIVGDFKQLLIGLRLAAEIMISRDASDSSSSAMANHQVFIGVALRGDVLVARPTHFSLLSGITSA